MNFFNPRIPEGATAMSKTISPRIAPRRDRQVKGGKSCRPTQSSTNKISLLDLRFTQADGMVWNTTSPADRPALSTIFLKDGNLWVLRTNLFKLRKGSPKPPPKEGWF